MSPPASERDALVIGAGIAGLVAARELRRAGLAVEIVEKSRGLGGRAATRTVEGHRVDHGAQFFTARDPRFRREVDAWLADGVARAWATGLPTWTADGGWSHAGAGAHLRYACPNGMNALGKRLAEGLTVTRRTRVTEIRREGEGWRAAADDGTTCRAPRLVVTAPVPQALELLRAVDLSGETRHALAAIAYAPCFAVMAGYPDAPAPAWPGVRLPDHPDLAWIANDGSRRAAAGARAAAGGGTVLVLHATPAFTRRRYDDPPADVRRDLLRAAVAVVPWAERPAWVDHQRWRYALPERTHPAAAPMVADGLVLAGDAFGGDAGGRIEGAYLSGLAAAAALIDGDRRAGTG